MLGALQPHFELATSKLSALEGKSHIAKWPGKVVSVPAYFPLIAPTIHPDILACAQQALMNDRQLIGRYCSTHLNHPSDVVLHPLGMIQRGPITYLVARTQSHDDVRQYALHRLSELKVSDQPSTSPDGFDLKAYAASGAMQFGDNATGKITLEAWVNTGLLRMLRETPLSEDMETMTSDDGGWIRAEVADSWELEWWLLSHTGSITVIAPDSLKQRLVERLRRGIELYADE
jgi:predicted DNA-binding transcriptional regulator YafY